MKKLIKFPSIEQFRNIIASVNREYSFVGLDENGEAIYDASKGKPVLTFKGTVKLHGTNFGICYNDIDGIWAQSKENIITIKKDNAGSAMFVESHKDAFMKMFAEISKKNNINTSTHTISIFAEWAGKGIQSKVAICQIEKAAFIIGIKIAPIANDETSIWIDHSGYRDIENRIFNIEDYKTFDIDIDFNMPQLVQNKIIELTLEVEKECPVGKAFFNEVMTDNIAYEENGKIWFDKENGFTNEFKRELTNKFKELRQQNKNGVNYIKFSLAEI